MKSSSVASSLKHEQVDASKLQEGVLNNLELRLGISSDNGLCGGGGTTNPWLGVGVHPWSLSSGQDKAALEQVQQRPNESHMQREDRPQVVGWPPLCTFRKNLSTTSTRSAYSQDLSKVEPCSEEEEDHGNTGVSGQERPAMFVKVNLEGYAVGRKIDINAHHSYTSLSGALQSMFHGFLSDGHRRIATREDGEQLERQKGNGGMKNYILLYEDNEGDRMLVGDVPWELFIASVKRLYITKDSRADKSDTKNSVT
ncbi:auxin-responsive protein IAA25 [Lolium perenne]|uniref:auxin-responsive protein IAA25 n=1 Tax=Lolium perenne TaxID=4522 RepID=UPI0021F54881|nr:auxin-responsive protein IAA25-like [Lolium perenne]XP_051200630.1 auxin-responsive protein IAA25-like [Lolium perenne]XP_051200631.1 auxin-responsive protein IAA25-like [Lolium perenne]